MNEVEVQATHMQALKALADTNIKISEARTTLSKLEELETEYLVSREKKAIERIQKILESSHNLVEDINKNYEDIQSFASAVFAGGEMLSKVYEKFKEFIGFKEKHFEAWERDIKNKEETIGSLRNGLKVEAVQIASQGKALDIRTLELNALKSKINDDLGILDRGIERLKQNRI